MGTLQGTLLEISDISQDSSRWGGKATILARLVKAGLPVPPGLVIGTEWHQKYLEVLSNLNSDHLLEVLFRDLQSVMHSAPGWPEISNSSYIVRSSANVEGISEMSFSGYFESIVIDEDESLDGAIRKVWDCVNDPAVKKYAQRHHTPLKIEMAVIINALIEGQYAGVMQTKDVISGSYDRLLIEYENWRLGAVVDGKESTYSLVLDRATGGILEGSNHSGINSILPKLFDYALKCEKTLESSLELEWVSTPDQVWIVQGRPLEFKV